jgi:hypothetical protein
MPTPEILSDLPLVLAALHGYIGFADLAERRYVSALFAAPDWAHVRQGETIDRSEYFALRLSAPEKWPFIAAGLQKQVPPEARVVYALLPLNAEPAIVRPDQTPERRTQCFLPSEGAHCIIGIRSRRFSGHQRRVGCSCQSGSIR